jgi:hypothetical protein
LSQQLQRANWLAQDWLRHGDTAATLALRRALTGPGGPVWERRFGEAEAEAEQEQEHQPQERGVCGEARAVLDAIGGGAQHMVMGHTPQYAAMVPPRGINAACARDALWRIDVGMSRAFDGGKSPAQIRTSQRAMQRRAARAPQALEILDNGARVNVLRCSGSVLGTPASQLDSHDTVHEKRAVQALLQTWQQKAQ